MTNRELLLKKIAITDFAMVELRLYLDSHPNDISATNKLEEYRFKSKELTKEYAEKFGPLCIKDQSPTPYAWIENPWPWDNICMEGK